MVMEENAGTKKVTVRLPKKLYERIEDDRIDYFPKKETLSAAIIRLLDYCFMRRELDGIERRLREENESKNM